MQVPEIFFRILNFVTRGKSTISQSARIIQAARITEDCENMGRDAVNYYVCMHAGVLCVCVALAWFGSCCVIPFYKRIFYV